jgi:hypothetical protein
MAFTFDNALTLGSIATQLFQANESYNVSAQQAARANLKAQRDMAARNETLQMNQQLIRQEQMLEMKSLGFDLNDISKQTRAAKATALASFNAQGGATSQSLNAHMLNVSRQGADARRTRNYNYGVRYKQAEVELRSIRRATDAANRSANFVEAPSRTGLNLATLGLGIEAVQKVGFKTDVKTGKKTLSFGTGQ